MAKRPAPRLRSFARLWRAERPSEDERPGRRKAPHQPQGCRQRHRWRCPVSLRHSSLTRLDHVVVDSRAGHDCERQSTGVGWISNDKPATACNESCASTNTDSEPSQSATLEQQSEGACDACLLRTLPVVAQCAGPHFLNVVDQTESKPSLDAGVLIMRTGPTLLLRNPPPAAIVRAALAPPRSPGCSRRWT